MRRFVVLLAGFGLVLLFLTGGAYVYFRGQIPPVQAESDRFVVRADSGVILRPMLNELRTATQRFERLLGSQAVLPRLEVAVIDDPKQMNAVALYVAIRQSMGTAADRLPLPYPTPRLVSRLLGEPQSEARLATGRRGLGHEAGHWLLRLHLAGRRGESDDPVERENDLPTWLREGIAGFCEPTEARLSALLRVRTALGEHTGGDALDLQRFLTDAPPPVSRPAWAHEEVWANESESETAELYYAQALLLVEYLEARHPATIRKWLGRRSGETVFDRDPLLNDQDAFREWILTVPPLSL